jgi:hypothetical protein
LKFRNEQILKTQNLKMLPKEKTAIVNSIMINPKETITTIEKVAVVRVDIKRTKEDNGKTTTSIKKTISLPEQNGSKKMTKKSRSLRKKQRLT